MEIIVDLLIRAAQLINVLLIVWFVTGLLFAFNVVSRSNQVAYAIYDGLSRLFEPVLRPIRRIMPDTGQLDLSPMIFIFLLFTVIQILDGMT
jgi:YggT family protein